MIEYQAGQRVRIEFPASDALPGKVTVEGVLEIEGATGKPVLYVPGTGGYIMPELDGQDRIVTVLAEPRPEEPRNLGAVVIAGFEEQCERRVFVHVGAATWYGVGIGLVSWPLLTDPVIEHEGWVQ